MRLIRRRDSDVAGNLVGERWQTRLSKGAAESWTISQSVVG